jgi:asparaginyl-tRNA synthetase
MTSPLAQMSGKPGSISDSINFQSSWTDLERHFDTCLQDPWYAAIFQVSAAIAARSARFFEQCGYLHALAPITVSSISSPMGLGSDSSPVEISLFDRKTYLADSMQFQLEYLTRLHHKGVYYIMPSFRGEDPDSRHLNEFFHIEAEVEGDLDDIMVLVENLLIAIAKNLLASHGPAIREIAGTTLHLENLMGKAGDGFQQITFADAVDCLGGQAEFVRCLDGEPISLTSAGESRLMEQFGEPLWLTYLPKIGVPFYQADHDVRHSRCADLLMGIGEVVGCGQRHSAPHEIEQAMALRDVDPEPYAWYLRLKRNYPLKTSGFGLGLERLLLWIFKHDDIRDTQIFIRQKGVSGAP